MLTNWKTSLAGLGALLVAVGHILTSVAGGGGIEAVDVTAIIASIGLFAAKDHNVTGGTVKQMLAFAILAAGSAMLLGGSARAADMPMGALGAMPVKAPALASTPCTQTMCSGFYVGGNIVGAGSNMDILGSGINGSVFAGGGGIGIDAGYQFWNGRFFFAFSAFGDYEVGNAQLAPGSGNQNRYLFGEMAKFGIGLSGLFGGAPTGPATPTQTPAAISIPTSITNALMSPYIQFGAIERPWGTGWASGAGAEFVLAQNWNLDISYIHAIYNNIVVNPGQIQKADDLVKMSLLYKF